MAQTPAHQQSRRGRLQRNAPLGDTHRSVPAWRVEGVRFRVKGFVELKEPVGNWEAQFVELRQIWVDGEGDVVLRGLSYTRTRHTGRCKQSTNELCQIVEVDDDDSRADEEQAMVQVRPQDILGLREVNKTNTDFSSARNCRFGNDPAWLELGNSTEANRRREEEAPLTCRYRMLLQHRDASHRRENKAHTTTIHHWSESDIDDPAYRVSDKERRYGWLRRHPPSVARASAPPQYTFADAFCGAGGASSGARQGGLKVSIAIDHWADACRSYRENFPDTQLFQEDIAEFIQKKRVGNLPYIDVLHISPPCQFYSPAKVTEGKNDEANEVALYSCVELVKKLRPRIITMEQTFGLGERGQFDQHFNMLIQDYTNHGFSIQWRKRVKFIKYGLPQDRKRLIIIGAAPGEKLPPWPAPTHGNDPSLLRPYTEAQAIADLPRGLSLHDVQLRSSRQMMSLMGRNPNMPLPRTITCSGAQGLAHFSGKREHTLRELATLQGFPLNHRFEGRNTMIKKQIGNAFPASVARIFYRNIRKFLQRQDGYEASPTPPPSPPRSTYRAHGSQHTPSYDHLNGDLDEDEALQIAMHESRHHTRGPNVIPVDDSDSDVSSDVDEVLQVHSLSDSDSESDECELSNRMRRMSVAPNLPFFVDSPTPPTAAPPLDSPPTTGGSFRSQQTASSSSPASAKWSAMGTPARPPRRRTAFFHNKHTSITPDDSPTPEQSPSQDQSRKRKPDGQAGSARKRARDAVDNVVIVIGAEKPADKRERARAESSDWEVSAISSRSVAQRLAASGRRPRQPSAVSSLGQASLPPREEDERPLGFGNWLMKLPVSRNDSSLWEF